MKFNISFSANGKSSADKPVSAHGMFQEVVLGGPIKQNLLAKRIARR
ncbi:hypothetical protein [Chryseobacterium shigense]|uniref:Uncharacterized protein n=1 Tax=Chryseobacterium shigense TaxID=297244 RepID=A0A841N682_9FLAO|nr:hypothetical protein [Chryseobacterium shigense]MBB6368988.1 hypothetical protein [Chryseobacterium shigense]